MTDLRKLDAAATQGVWEFKPKGIAHYTINAQGSGLTWLGPLHHQSMSSRNAALAAALVNAYRAGELVEAPKEADHG